MVRGLGYRLEQEGLITQPSRYVEGEALGSIRGIVAYDKVHTSVEELKDETREIFETVCDMNELSRAAVELETEIIPTIAESLEGGEGMSVREARQVEARLESICKRIGVPRSKISTLTYRRENFMGLRSRYKETKIYLENSEGMLTKFWRWFARLWDNVVLLIKKFLANTISKFSDLEQMVKVAGNKIRDLRAALKTGSVEKGTEQVEAGTEVLVFGNTEGKINEVLAVVDRTKYYRDITAQMSKDKLQHNSSINGFNLISQIVYGALGDVFILKNKLGHGLEIDGTFPKYEDKKQGFEELMRNSENSAKAKGVGYDFFTDWSGLAGDGKPGVVLEIPLHANKVVGVILQGKDTATNINFEKSDTIHKPEPIEVFDPAELDQLYGAILAAENEWSNIKAVNSVLEQNLEEISKIIENQQGTVDENFSKTDDEKVKMFAKRVDETIQDLTNLEKLMAEHAKTEEDFKAKKDKILKAMEDFKKKKEEAVKDIQQLQSNYQALLSEYPEVKKSVKSFEELVKAPADPKTIKGFIASATNAIKEAVAKVTKKAKNAMEAGFKKINTLISAIIGQGSKLLHSASQIAANQGVKLVFNLKDRTDLKVVDDAFRSAIGLVQANEDVVNKQELAKLEADLKAFRESSAKEVEEAKENANTTIQKDPTVNDQSKAEAALNLTNQRILGTLAKGYYGVLAPEFIVSSYEIIKAGCEMIIGHCNGYVETSSS